MKKMIVIFLVVVFAVSVRAEESWKREFRKEYPVLFKELLRESNVRARQERASSRSFSEQQQRERYEDEFLKRFYEDLKAQQRQDLERREFGRESSRFY